MKTPRRKATSRRARSTGSSPKTRTGKAAKQSARSAPKKAAAKKTASRPTKKAAKKAAKKATKKAAKKTTKKAAKKSGKKANKKSGKQAKAARKAPELRAAMQGPPKPVVRLARIIKEAGAEEGGFLPLSRAIGLAYGSAPRAEGERRDRNIPDRRKLQLIANDKDFTLSKQEIFAIDAYLSQKNLSLAHTPLLQKPEMVRVLAEREHVVYLVGARSMSTSSDRVFIADYDLLAMSEVAQRVSRLDGPPIDVRDIVLPSTPEEAERAVKDAGDDVFDDHGPSLVCIASPRANAGCEYMLAQMFDVTPWEDDQVPVLPFHFLWPDRPEEPDLPSILQLAPAANPAPLTGAHAALARANPKNSALILEDEVLQADPPRRDNARDLGIICCQRRKGGQLWVCVLGLSGPATLAAAMAIDHVTAAVPTHVPGKSSDVLWVVVEARLRRGAAMSGQAIRGVMSYSLPSPAEYWNKG